MPTDGSEDGAYESELRAKSESRVMSKSESALSLSEWGWRGRPWSGAEVRDVPAWLRSSRCKCRLIAGTDSISRY